MRVVQKAIVWSLERVCALKDATVGRSYKLMPKSLWDKDWRWLGWVYGCNLASVSAELDEKWETGVWK